MGNNQRDLEEIERQENIRKSEVIAKYGFDINEYFKKSNNKESIHKRKKAKRNIKLISIVLILIIVLFSVYSIKLNKTTKKIKGLIELDCNEEVELNSSKTLFGKNGFYEFKVKDNSEIKIHAFMENENFIDDTEDRFHKYYFENWNDEEKSRFIVEENYDECSYGLIKEKYWILNYKTFIEVNNYEEMLSATDLIIKFLEYMNEPSALVKCYIKIDNNFILPHNVSEQTNEQIREMAIMQYVKIVKENNLNSSDIPNSILEKYDM